MIPSDIRQWFADKHRAPYYGDLVISNRTEGWNSALYAAESFIRQQIESGRLVPADPPDARIEVLS